MSGLLQYQENPDITQVAGVISKGSDKQAAAAQVRALQFCGQDGSRAEIQRPHINNPAAGLLPSRMKG